VSRRTLFLIHRVQERECANFPVIRIDARTRDRFIDLLYMRNHSICKGKERWNILSHFLRDAGPSIYFRLFAICHEIRCFRSFAFPRESEWKSTWSTLRYKCFGTSKNILRTLWLINQRLRSIQVDRHPVRLDCR